MAALSENEEILDLVDAYDRVVDTIIRKDIYDYRNFSPHYLRAVNALIINDSGRLWIPRRTADKKYAANGLDYGVGEHVMSGENYDDAVVRGFDEELNMTVDVDNLELFYASKPGSFAGDVYFVNNYLYRSNQAPDYNTDDFSGAEWLTPEEVILRGNQGEVTKPGLLEVMQALLDYQAQRERR